MSSKQTYLGFEALNHNDRHLILGLMAIGHAVISTDNNEAVAEFLASNLDEISGAGVNAAFDELKGAGFGTDAGWLRVQELGLALVGSLDADHDAAPEAL